MKKAIALFSASILSFCVVSWAEPEHEHDHDDDAPTSQPAQHISLEREMGAMGRQFKIIRKQVSDASQNASTLAAVLELEQHTLAAKSATPDSATTMPSDAENQEKLAAYQDKMVELLRTELNLEQALRSADNTRAQSLVDDLKGLESSGHHEFRQRH
jgi:hypothetical protein